MGHCTLTDLAEEEQIAFAGHHHEQTTILAPADCRYAILSFTNLQGHRPEHYASCRVHLLEQWLQNLESGQG